MPRNSSSGTSLPNTSAIDTFAAQRTPAMLMPASSSSEPATTAMRPPVSLASGQKRPTAAARPLASEAAVAMRVSQIIQPTWNPANGPNASRAYSALPPCTSK